MKRMLLNVLRYFRISLEVFAYLKSGLISWVFRKKFVRPHMPFTGVVSCESLYDFSSLTCRKI